MYYIYLLKWQGIPLYAGMTKRPVNRFKLHYYDPTCSTYKLVRYYLYHFRKPVEMEIVYCTSNELEANDMEGKAIKALGQAGFAVLNVNGTSYKSEKIPVFDTVPEFNSKWISPFIYLDIYNQRIKIQKEYGYEEYRHNNLDYPKSISRPFRYRRSKRPQLGKKKQNRKPKAPRLKNSSSK